MGSNGLTSMPGNPLMPFLAILKHDLRTLAGSWLVRLWLGGTVLWTLVAVLGNWPQLQTAPLIAFLLFPYLVFPWFLVVMVLGINPVSESRAEALADGFLSRPITRYEYLLGAWSARLLVVLAVYLVVMIPAIWIVNTVDRPVPADKVTLYGTVAALGVVALVLTFQVTLAFFVGTLMRRPILAIVLLLFIWYPVNIVLDAFKWEEFSPITLNRRLPTLLRKPWRKPDDTLASTASQAEMEALARQTEQLLNLLSGAPKQVKREPQFFERDEEKECSLARVVLGYGLPTLLALGLTTLSFCYRDL